MAEPNNALVESNPNFLTLPTEEFLTSYHLQPIIDDSWIREEELVHLDDLRENEGGERIKRELLQNYQVKARGSTINPVLEGMNYQEMFFAQYNQNERYTDQFAAEKYKKQNLENYRQRRPSREMNERFVEEGMADGVRWETD
ncbi:hypothetical protein AGDE_06007 [Angomonas deanei]|nr:hypothetical protein AGDE_06007 [Angomonas deanei]|eukprot:EPY37926.1 hypothetical protein AGDE_06007 [Angomonas deanei]